MKIGLIDVDGKFKPIDGYNGRYIIFETGVVVSMYRFSNIHGTMTRIDKPKILTPSHDKKGYMIVNLYDGNGGRKSSKVHRLVACAFLPNPDNKRCVCHKDNDTSNNCADNLYWGTDKENQNQAWKDGLHKNICAVKQLTKTGETVKHFSSESEASRVTGIPQANIWKCISGERKSAGGYVWQKSD